MKKSGKVIVLVLCLSILLGAFTGCKANEGRKKPDPLSEPLNIGTLMGPTGMGMASLFGREEEGFKLSLFTAPDKAVAAILNGEVDLAAVPSNLAAVLYNKTEGGIKLLGVNTGGVLYLVSNGAEPLGSLKDLKGKTLYASGMGAVPEFALNALLEAEGMSPEDVNTTWMSSHADVTSTLLTEGGYALMPEPQVTVALSKKETVKIELDINALWKDSFGYDLPMGVLICRGAVAESRPGDIDFFLDAYLAGVKSLESDTDAACRIIEEQGILPSAGIAKDALPRCNIMLETNYDKLSAILTPLFETLYESNPKSVGGKIPGEDFYFSKDNPSDYSYRPKF